MRLSRTAAVAVLGLAAPLALAAPSSAAPGPQFGGQFGTSHQVSSANGCSVTDEKPDNVKAIVGDGDAHRVRRTEDATVTSSSDPSDITHVTNSATVVNTTTKSGRYLDKAVTKATLSSGAVAELGSSSTCAAVGTAGGLTELGFLVPKNGVLKISGTTSGPSSAVVLMQSGSDNGAAVLNATYKAKSFAQTVAVKAGETYQMQYGGIVKSDGSGGFFFRARQGVVTISVDYVAR